MHAIPLELRFSICFDCIALYMQSTAAHTPIPNASLHVSFIGRVLLILASTSALSTFPPRFSSMLSDTSSPLLFAPAHCCHCCQLTWGWAEHQSYSFPASLYHLCCSWMRLAPCAATLCSWSRAGVAKTTSIRPSPRGVKWWGGNG